MFADRINKLQGLPISRAPDIKVPVQETSKAKEEEISSFLAKEEIDYQLGVGKKMSFIAPNLLGCSDKTGMKYYRELKYFYPPDYLAKGSDRSPSFTPEGIKIINQYLSLSREEKFKYKLELQAAYEERLKESGVSVVEEEQADAIAIQAAQLICEKVVLNVDNILVKQCERLVQRARVIAAKYAPRIKAELYTSLDEELGEENNGID